MAKSRTRQLLADLLLGSDSRAVGAAGRFDEPGLWDDAITTAAEWKVIPQLTSQLDRLRHSVPRASVLRLKRLAIESRGRSAFLAAKGAAAIGHLEAGGVRTATFKGLASIARLYRDATCRTLADVDLLVAERDLNRAVSILEENGYRRNIDSDFEKYAAFVSRSPAFAGSKSITLRGAAVGAIDLHWAVAKGLDPAGILDRAERVPLRDRTIPVVSVEDGVLLTASHASRQNLNIGSACRDLIDLKIALTLVARRSTSEGLQELAAGAGMTTLLATIAGILRKFDAEFPAGVIPRTENRASADLVELFLDQVREGEISKDLLYLTHWSPCWQIVSGLAASPRSYRRFMQVFETEIAGRPVPLRNRLLMLTESIWKLRRKRLRSLRALARVKYD